MNSDEKNTAPDPFEMVRKIKTRGPAPVHLWDPPCCGEMDMLIARDGSWIHEGKPIRRAAMVALFASVLKREGDEYYLVTPVEKVKIRVEDCPFVAQQMDASGQGESQRLTFKTNLGETAVADAEHPLSIDTDPETGEPHPRIHIRSGLDALINRAVFYRLVNLAESGETSDGESRMGVWSGGSFFPLDGNNAPASEG